MLARQEMESFTIAERLSLLQLGATLSSYYFLPRIVISVEHQDGSASTGDDSNPRPFSLTSSQLGVRYRAQELVQATLNHLRFLILPGRGLRCDKIQPIDLK